MQKTLDRIREEALILFNAEGYEATSLRQISLNAGITPSAIYFHFRSKEELFLNIMECCMDRYLNYMERCIKEIKGQSLDEKLFKIFKSETNFMLENRETSTFLIRNFYFPPMKLQDKIHLQSLEWYKSITNIISYTFEKYFEENGLNENLRYEIVCSFDTFIRAYIFHIMNYNIDLTDENLNNAWSIYWNGLKNTLE